MQEKIKRILFAYLEEKSGSNYVSPMRKEMPNYPFYQEQEKTYTDLVPLDSVHGIPTPDKNDKMFVYPEQETTNPDWAGGNFLSPYDEQIFHKEIWRTPNDAETLQDPYMTSPEMHGLNEKTSAAIDYFLKDDNAYIKVASMDLTDFMKISDDTLVHKSNKDLWKMFKDAEGNIFIERMFEDELIKEKE